MTKKTIIFFLLGCFMLSLPLYSMTEAEKARKINELQTQINQKQKQARNIQEEMQQKQRGKVANYLSPIELERMNQQMTNYRSEAYQMESQLNRLYSTPTSAVSESPGGAPTIAKGKKTYSPVLKKDATVSVSIENELMRDSKPGLRDQRLEFVLKESNNVGVIFTGYQMWVRLPDGTEKEKQTPLNLRLVPMGEARVAGEVKFEYDPQLFPNDNIQYTIRVKFTGVDDLGNPIDVQDEFMR